MAIRNSILILFFSLITVVVLYAQPPYPSKDNKFTVDQVKGCAPFTVTLTDISGACGICLMDYEGKGTVQNQLTYTYTTPGTFTLSVLYPSTGKDEISITVVGNTQPPFEMYSCAGDQVSIRVVDNKYEQYVINFGDGSPDVLRPFTNNIVAPSNYAGAGTYKISVRGRNTGSADNCTATVQSFTTTTSLTPPAISALTALDANTIKLNFGKQTHIQQRMEIAVNNASTFQLYQSMYEKDTLRVPAIKVDDNYYCFRLSAYDPCSNGNHYSNIICSQNFDLTIDNAVNKLAWATGTVGITSTTIQRDKQNYTTLPLAPLSFDDEDIVCKTEYCYRVVSNYPGGAKSTSLEKCGTSFSTTTLPQIDNVSAVVTDPGVDLNWVIDPKINKPQYTLFRSIGGADYQPFATAADKKFTDAEYTTAGAYCYRVDYTDACGNFSPGGIPTCPIRLTGSLGDHNIVSLSWTKFTGWKDGVRGYIVDRSTASGKLGSITVGTDTSYVEDPPDAKNQAIKYTVRAISFKTGLTASVSNTVEIVKKTNLYSPTAFTPNRDKLNETFTISGQYIKKISLKIFDRWGVLIFLSEGGDTWNGNREGSGQAMPEGTYVWKAEVTDTSGKQFTREGTVFLIRTSN